MEQLPSEIYLKTQLKFSRNLGVWPWTTGAPLWKRFVCKTIFWIMLLLKLGSFSCLLYHVYIEWGHLPNPFDNVIMGSVHLNCIFGMIYVPYKIEAFLELLKSMDKIFILPEEKSEDEMERLEMQIYVRYMKSAAFITKFLLGSAMATGMTACIEPLMNKEGERQFPMLVSFPFDVSSGIYYWYAYIFLASSWLSSCINGTINCDLFLSLIIKTTCQFHFLKLRLLKITDSVKKQKLTEKSKSKESVNFVKPVKQLKIKFLDLSEENSNEEIPEEEDDDDLMVQNLKECIKYHQALFEFVAALESQVSPFMFMQMFVYFIFLCMNIFGISLVPVASIAFVEQLLFITCVICMLLGFSWHGNELKLKSMEVADTAYNCDWTNGPQAFKKSLVMLILRAQKPVVLTALKFFPVDLSFFIGVMKTSYSYFQVMRTMYSEEP